MSRGPAGSVSSVVCQVKAGPLSRNVSCCTAVSRGLASISAKSALAAKFGRDPADGADHVLHQRAATGADLGDRHWQGFSARPPRLDEPDGDKFAEHLADLGGGDEVALGAERLARRVVAVVGVEQADRHVVRDRDRSGGADQAGDLFAEAVHAAERATCDLARQIAQKPKSTIGADSTMPMVSQPPAR